MAVVVVVELVQSEIIIIKLALPLLSETSETHERSQFEWPAHEGQIPSFLL